MKKTHIRRSECPINFTLEMVGDGWSLLIIRDIVYFGKRTFGEFAASSEGIARNILTNRLQFLEQSGIITKKPHPTDGRKEIYALTEKGLALVPLLLEMAEWGAQNAPSTDAPAWWLKTVQDHREKIIELTKRTIRKGGSIFVGENSVVSRLNIR